MKVRELKNPKDRVVYSEGSAYNMIKTIIKSMLAQRGYSVQRINKQDYLAPNPCVEEPYKSLPFAGLAVKKIIEEYDFQTVLDIGSGAGAHSDFYLRKGKKVTAVDLGRSIYFERRTNNYICIKGDFLKIQFKEKYDCIWVSHVLEHQLNVNQFLLKCIECCKPGGLIVITVPPRKDQLVGGHLTLWTPGLLIYNLVMAGLNCSDASILVYGYNISVIVRNVKRDDVRLDCDSGDIDRLKPFFPECLAEGKSGWINEFNWKH